MVNYNYPLRTEEDIDRKQYSKLVKKCLEQKSKNNLISED
jgi:hypothetical protein